MAIYPIPVDQRVIDIDSRRFASVEKALVELITNSDDSYARLSAGDVPASGSIRVLYERHKAGARLTVTDQTEGMAFSTASFILAYGGAHSPLSRGEGNGRGYFGRGLKQAIYGLGHGWIETVHEGRYSRIELFRGPDGDYLYDDGGGDRPVATEDRERLGIAANGTKVAIVVENPDVHLPLFRSLVQTVGNNIYLRDLLQRREVELISMRFERELERSGPIRFNEPEADVLIGPEQEASFTFDGSTHVFSLTLKRARDAELALRGDERTNGLVVISGMAVLDCQLFDFENQTGTEYLFGTVRCPALTGQLGRGVAIISDEREGLNHKNPFVQAFWSAVSRMIAPCVKAEQEALRHLEHATISGRTDHMIDVLLERMNRAAVQDLGIHIPPPAELPGTHPDPLRFSTPFYYRPPGHPFHVTLLLDPDAFAEGDTLEPDFDLPEGLLVEPAPTRVAIGALTPPGRIEWTLTGNAADSRGEITVRAGDYWAWCEIVVAHQAGIAHAHHGAMRSHARAPRPARDHGVQMFMGYDFRALDNDLDRAVYSPDERQILINTRAPTVQLYVDGRGHFRDSARLLLAELFMDVISDELARHMLEGRENASDPAALHTAKLDVIRRYGSDIHRYFMTG